MYLANEQKNEQDSDVTDEESHKAPRTESAQTPQRAESTEPSADVSRRLFEKDWVAAVVNKIKETGTLVNSLQACPIMGVKEKQREILTNLNALVPMMATRSYRDWDEMVFVAARQKDIPVFLTPYVLRVFHKHQELSQQGIAAHNAIPVLVFDAFIRRLVLDYASVADPSAKAMLVQSLAGVISQLMVQQHTAVPTTPAQPDQR